MRAAPHGCGAPTQGTAAGLPGVHNQNAVPGQARLAALTWAVAAWVPGCRASPDDGSAWNASDGLCRLYASYGVLGKAWAMILWLKG